jgi:ketosteroid isomerase-like protein
MPVLVDHLRTRDSRPVCKPLWAASPRRVAFQFLIASGAALALGCSTVAPSSSDANAGIDSLNQRLIRSYRDRDPKAYGALYTDTAQFEWPAFTTVRGPTALAEMARGNWATERDVDLRLDVTDRRVNGGHATEFGAFQQSWTDSSRAHMIEYGRYVTYLLRQPDGSWRMDRFFGFEDSTRPAVSRPR